MRLLLEALELKLLGITVIIQGRTGNVFAEKLADRVSKDHIVNGHFIRACFKY